MFTITANLKYVTFLQCWRNLWWGTLGGSEHRNTTKNVYKYRNLAKKISFSNLPFQSIALLSCVDLYY